MPGEKESEPNVPLDQYVADRFESEREISDLKYASKSEQSDLSERIGNLETGLRHRVTYKQVLTVILPLIVGSLCANKNDTQCGLEFVFS